MTLFPHNLYPNRNNDTIFFQILLLLCQINTSYHPSGLHAEIFHMLTFHIHHHQFSENENTVRIPSSVPDQNLSDYVL